MKTEILDNGDLQVFLDPDDDREDVASWGHDWPRLFEQLCGNGWRALLPEDVGALTDAPIITDEFEMADDGTITHVGRVWWFPNYCVENPVETLAATGSVIFTAAPENEKRKHA